MWCSRNSICFKYALAGSSLFLNVFICFGLTCKGREDGWRKSYFYSINPSLLTLPSCTSFFEQRRMERSTAAVVDYERGWGWMILWGWGCIDAPLGQFRSGSNCVTCSAPPPPLSDIKPFQPLGQMKEMKWNTKWRPAQNMKLHLLLTTNSILGNLRFRHHLQNMCCPV